MTAPYTPVSPPTDDADVFPILIGQNFISAKSPMWSTAIASATSGRERRRRQWSYPKWSFTVGYEVLQQQRPGLTELDRLYGFFNGHAGQYAPFSYFDPTDNLVTDCPFGTGDGTTKAFQLYRRGGVGAVPFTEPVRSVLGTPKVSVGVSDVTAFTISGGVLTFTSAPASGAALTWSGQFMFRCRFAADQIDPAQMMQQLWSLSGLSFQTDKR